jgi:hypothetical protein
VQPVQFAARTPPPPLPASLRPLLTETVRKLCGSLRLWLRTLEAYRAKRYLLTRHMQITKGLLKETRERWPLLTVGTEVHRDLEGTNERGPSLVGLLGLSCRYKRVLFCLGCSSRPSTKYFFLTVLVHFFTSFVPIAQQAGQAAVLGRLSCNMCLWAIEKTPLTGGRAQDKGLSSVQKIPKLSLSDCVCVSAD